MSPVTESQPAVDGRAHSICDVGHQGLFFDKEWGWYDNRGRPYDPRMGRFAVRDHAGYQDGMNLYEYEGSNPATRLDPHGGDFFTSAWSYVKNVPAGLWDLAKELAATGYAVVMAEDAPWEDRPDPYDLLGVGMGRDFRSKHRIRGSYYLERFVVPVEVELADIYEDTERTLYRTGSFYEAFERAHYRFWRDVPIFGEALRTEERRKLIPDEELWGQHGRTTGKGLGIYLVAKAPDAAAWVKGKIASHPSGLVQGGIVAGDVTPIYESGVVSQYTGAGAQAALRASSSSGVISAESLIGAPHGNSLLSLRTCYLYRLETETGQFLKWGISQNPATRYPQSFMLDKRIIPMTNASRAEMAALERLLEQIDPGPLNRVPWAGKGQ